MSVITRPVDIPRNYVQKAPWKDAKSFECETALKDLQIQLFLTASLEQTYEQNGGTRMGQVIRQHYCYSNLMNMSSQWPSFCYPAYQAKYNTSQNFSLHVFIWSLENQFYVTCTATGISPAALTTVKRSWEPWHVEDEEIQTNLAQRSE